MSKHRQLSLLMLVLAVIAAITFVYGVNKVMEADADTYSKSATASITAQNIFSKTIALRGHYNLSLSGTWVATVHLQRSFDSGTTWMDVDSYTANTELVGYEPERGVIYRAGVKTGNYTSGTVAIRLSQ